MVTPAPRPGPRVGQGRAAVRPAARATRAAAAIVVAVVAQLEEPHQPDDQRADVEHAQPDHEDPARQRHCTVDSTSVAPHVKGRMNLLRGSLRTGGHPHSPSRRSPREPSPSCARHERRSVPRRRRRGIRHRPPWPGRPRGLANAVRHHRPEPVDPLQRPQPAGPARRAGNHRPPGRRVAHRHRLPARDRRPLRRRLGLGRLSRQSPHGHRRRRRPGVHPGPARPVVRRRLQPGARQDPRRLRRASEPPPQRRRGHGPERRQGPQPRDAPDRRRRVPELDVQRDAADRHDALRRRLGERHGAQAGSAQRRHPEGRASARDRRAGPGRLRHRRPREHRLPRHPHPRSARCRPLQGGPQHGRDAPAGRIGGGRGLVVTGLAASQDA